MTAVVPGDNTPAAIGDEWAKDIESAGEVRAAMYQEHDWIGLATPFIDSNADAIGRDAAKTVGLSRAWVRTNIGRHGC